ncbi:MAG: hypothetical protein JW739_05800 [Opitutales bacterium]|nr:hypothetical protein [Opitutales bacterium]
MDDTQKQKWKDYIHRGLRQNVDPYPRHFPKYLPVPDGVSRTEYEALYNEVVSEYPEGLLMTREEDELYQQGKQWW